MRSPHDQPTLAGRAFYTSAFMTSLVIGGLQMYRVHAGVLTDYGADVFGAAWLYAMTRLGRTVVQRGRTVRPVPTAVVVFGLCTASELGQLAGIVPGRYDPFDIVAFLAAVVASVIIERWLGPFAARPAPVAAATNRDGGERGTTCGTSSRRPVHAPHDLLTQRSRGGACLRRRWT